MLNFMTEEKMGEWPGIAVSMLKRLRKRVFELQLKRTRNIFKKDIRRLSNTYNFNTTK